MKILFLDIDGVLNLHEYNEKAESNTINPVFVKNLNHVLDSTNCNIVITSAWRYMILKNAMTLQGFEYLLRTHGIHCVGKLIGTTRLDKDVNDKTERGKQIQDWIIRNMMWLPANTVWAIVDDLDLGLTLAYPEYAVIVKNGLNEAAANKLIKILERGE